MKRLAIAALIGAFMATPLAQAGKDYDSVVKYTQHDPITGAVTATREKVNAYRWDNKDKPRFVLKAIDLAGSPEPGGRITDKDGSVWAVTSFNKAELGTKYIVYVSKIN